PRPTGGFQAPPAPPRRRATSAAPTAVAGPLNTALATTVQVTRGQLRNVMSAPATVATPSPTSTVTMLARPCSASSPWAYPLASSSPSVGYDDATVAVSSVTS